MEIPILSARERATGGKGAARQLRLKGRIPGIYYRINDSNLTFDVDRRDFNGLLRSHPSLINLQVEGKEERECIIRALQRDPVSEEVLHIDLLGVQRGVKLTVTIPVHMKGSPVGVKMGGILEHGLDHVEVECLPKDIPSEILLDVSSLEIGQSIHVSDLNYPELRFLEEPGIVLATVVAPTVPKEPGEEAVEEEPEEEEGESKE